MNAGFANFWRNGFVSLSSILIMVVTLSVIASIIFMNATLSSTLDQIRGRVDINVYFIRTATESDILTIKKDLQALPQVSSVEYISRDQALQDFKDKHQNDQLTLQALSELGDNPLSATLNIRAKDPSQYEGIATFLNSKNAVSTDGTPIIDKVNYYQNKAAIDKLSRIIDSARNLGVAITAILALISIIITFNTLRLVIYTSREEIAVMKLVGASNRYIRGPFVISGILYGLIAALITLLIFYPLTYWLGPKTANFFTDINVYQYYLANLGQISLILFGSGIIIASISTYLAVKKHLNV